MDPRLLLNAISKLTHKALPKTTSGENLGGVRRTVLNWHFGCTHTILETKKGQHQRVSQVTAGSFVHVALCFPVPIPVWFSLTTEGKVSASQWLQWFSPSHHCFTPLLPPWQRTLGHHSGVGASFPTSLFPGCIQLKVGALPSGWSTPGLWAAGVPQSHQEMFLHGAVGDCHFSWLMERCVGHLPWTGQCWACSLTWLHGAAGSAPPLVLWQVPLLQFLPYL